MTSLPLHPTHYDILALTPSMLINSQDPSSLIKKAYHRALLRHHPDKDTPSRNPAGQRTAMYTIDQITAAYAVLSSPSRRASYDSSLRAPLAASSDGQWATRFQTGVENVDLDDLALDEEGERWYRSCRCGNDRGYSFEENDLTLVEDQGMLMVPCQDCSLWLRVHFAVVEEEQEEGEKKEEGDDKHDAATSQYEMKKT